VNKYVMSVLMAVLWIGAPLVHADDASNHFPPTFKYSGIVTAVNYSEHMLVIGEDHIKLSDVATVHDLHRSGSITMLKPGQWVGCSPSKNSWDGATVNDVWILPAGRMEHPVESTEPATEGH